jgi:hypothetical protein
LIKWQKHGNLKKWQKHGKTENAAGSVSVVVNAIFRLHPLAPD